MSYSETVIRVIGTALAINEDGRQIDIDDLIDDLMADYGWSEDEAEAAIAEAEACGATFEGPPRGTPLQ